MDLSEYIQRRAAARKERQSRYRSHKRAVAEIGKIDVVEKYPERPRKYGWDPERKKMINDYKRKNRGPSELDRINASKALVQEKIDKLIEKGAVKIEPIDRASLEAVDALGKMCSYVRKDGKYRSGGIITKLEDDWFSMLGGGGLLPVMTFCVQYADVKECYLRARERNKTGPLEPKPTTKPETKYPVKVGDVTVRYFQNASSKRRFLNGPVYKRMLEWVEQNQPEKVEKKPKAVKAAKKKVAKKPPAKK